MSNNNVGNGGISPLLDQLTCDLIGGCLDLIAEQAEIPLVLTYCDEDGIPENYTFDGDGPNECLSAAHAQVHKVADSICAYAIAYQGFVCVEEGAPAVDALIVEFGEKGAPCAYSAYVPYARAGQGEAFEFGEPLAAGEEPLLLA